MTWKACTESRGTCLVLMCNHRWGWESATSACLTHAGSGKINKEKYLSLWRNFNCLNMLNFEYYSILLHFNFLDLPWEIQKKDTVCTKLLMCWRNICQNVGLGFSFNYISKGWQKWQTGKLSKYLYTYFVYSNWQTVLIEMHVSTKTYVYIRVT